MTTVLSIYIDPFNFKMILVGCGSYVILLIDCDYIEAMLYGYSLCLLLNLHVCVEFTLISLFKGLLW